MNDENTAEQTLEFVNRYRQIRGLPTLAEMPETIGHLASQGSLARALEASVVRHGDNGLFYALTRDEQKMKDLQQAGARLFQTCRASTREPEAGMIYEISLPRFAYKHAI